MRRISQGMHSIIVVMTFVVSAASADAIAQRSARDYPSIQAAIDAAVGGVIEIPAGDWEIREPIFVRVNSTVITGDGRIIQTNPDRAIIRMENVKDVTIRGVTLTRAEGKMDTREAAIRADGCEDLRIEGVKILDNRTDSAAIHIESGQRVTIRNSEIVNYKRISVDDRTDSDHYGYAFHCINGHGIIIGNSRGSMVLHNRIIENNLLPTREMKEKHKLGKLTDGRKPSHAGTLARGVLERGEVQNWHQGSAMIVSGPAQSELTQVIGNQIENCAQGIDLHCDRVVCSQNTIHCAMIGIKAMHGSRNVMLTQNIISRADLWGIMMGPGTATFPADEKRGENVDGGNVISDNIIADYGMGHEFWNWGGASKGREGCFAIRLDRGQLPDNPPITGVVITGNVVQDSTRFDAKQGAEDAGPLYKYALFVDPESDRTDIAPSPRGIVVGENYFDPGVAGVSNLP